jgi:ABC-type transport system substrate-binding protein
MEMEKKNLAIIILAVVLVGSGIGNIILAMMTVVEEPEAGEVLKVARGANPVTLDPIDTWDSVSNDVINQVCEPLIGYDLTKPDLPLTPFLCTSWVWDDLTHLTFDLRENVYFHDGTLFTAAAVKHTYDRLNYFGNSTGLLPATKVEAFPASIYQINGTPIIKEVIVNDDYNCTIVLNAPFAPIEGLLAYTASYITCPTTAPADTMIDIAKVASGEHRLDGTGPFVLTNYKPNAEVRFARWERYWRTGAFFDQIVYVYYKDSVTANNAMLGLDIDYLGEGMASLKPQFIADANIHVEEVGTATIYWYIAFNTNKLSLTWRKAISYAFNYTYFIVEIEEGTGIRATNMVPPGFPGRNDTTTAATYDIPKARGYMQQLGHGTGWEVGTMGAGDTFTGGADEAKWLAADFQNWGFRTYPGSDFYAQLFARFSEDMQMIGVTLTQQDMVWSEYITKSKADPDFMNIFFSGWGPDYFETFNMIDPLLNPTSASNFAQINIPEINTYLELAAKETDTDTRYDYYRKLQSLAADKYFVHIPLMYSLLYVVHAENLEGFPYNINRDVYWYPCYRE